MVVYSSTQTPDNVQRSIAVALGIPYHNVRVITRRVGGGFGGKVFRSSAVRTNLFIFSELHSELQLGFHEHHVRMLYLPTLINLRKLLRLYLSPFVSFNTNGLRSNFLSPK